MPEGASSGSKFLVYACPSGCGAYEPSICSSLSTARVNDEQDRTMRRTLDAGALEGDDVRRGRGRVAAVEQLWVVVRHEHARDEDTEHLRYSQRLKINSPKRGRT